MIHKNVIIVEDDMIIQMYLNKIVKSIGYNVIGEARTFDRTIELIKKQVPDLILMDIGIKGDKDGIETVIEIQKAYSIPVIYITGNSDKFTLEKAKNTHPVCFIFKPIVENILKRKLLEVDSQLTH